MAAQTKFTSTAFLPAQWRSNAMAYTYDELKHKTVAELREIAAGAEAEHEELRGYTQLNKEHLVAALCRALGIEMHHHHEVLGINKTDIKSRIRALKKQRSEALDSHDHAQLKSVRRQIHRLKREIHKATV
jgi:hypothetical protein